MKDKNHEQKFTHWSKSKDDSMTFCVFLIFVLIGLVGILTTIKFLFA